MGDGNSLPKPEKRKGFSARDVAAVFIKYEARCAKCREKVSLGKYAIDHIQALDHLGAHTLDNWQLLCTPCHARKTVSDVKASAKGRRLRGETRVGPKQPIRSRGFNKNIRRKMNGTVERVS
jgi:5-methylcytosine-specific restriction endonuclease McrA